jgi:alpha-tubulin suppressor-like RCC1 family protein
MSRSSRVSLGAFAALILAGGCNDSVEPLDLAGPPSSMAVSAGDNQRGATGTALGAPLDILIVDSTGRGVPGVPVDWTVTGGSVSQPADTTDANGHSTVTWTLPAASGAYTATATSPVGQVTLAASAQPIGGAIVFRYIDAGGYHGCGITTTEQLLCWGYNGDGQLGIASTTMVPNPTLIPTVVRYRRVVAGFYHTCAYTLASKTVCWGANSDGRLGGGASGGSTSDPQTVILAPTIDTLHGDTLVTGSAELLAQNIAAGEAHTCAIDLSQHMACWGRNAEGQLGRGDASSFNPPTGVNSGDLWKEVSVGGLHTCAITLAGAARCWGYNVAGQLGDGTTGNSSTPVNVAGAGSFRTDPLVIFHSPDPDFPLPPGPFIAAGYDHSCGITTGGATACWGLNEYGQLGDGTTANRSTPATVAGGHAFAAVTGGLRHSCALDTGGAAWCWGDNTYGELGDGTTARSSTPVAVAGGLAFSYIKAGELSTCAVTGEGVAYCWGDNEYGQLGDGTTTASAVPVKVAFQP